MKKLLDHFLRRTPSEPASPAPLPEPAQEKARNPATKPLARIAVPARTVRPAWHNPTAGKRQALPERSAPVEMLTLTLGDFAERIPADLLGASMPDLSTPVTFDLASLSERIGRGDAGIPASELVQRMPGMFRPNAVIAPGRLVLFPWKKIHAILAQAKDGTSALGLTASGAETLSLKVRARKIHRSSKLAPATDRKDRPANSPGEPSKTPETAAAAIPSRLTLQTSAAQPEAGSPPPPDATQNNVSAKNSPTFQPEQQYHRAALEQEREAASAALTAAREELATLREQSATEHREFSTMLAKLTLLEEQQEESAKTTAELTAERDAAVARAAALEAAPKAGPAAESAPTDTEARLAELTAERDAARAQAAQASADNETALALASEQTEERDAALVRQNELAAERDAATARAATLATEIEAATARAAEFARELESARTRHTELAEERDAAKAHFAELQAAPMSPPAALPTTTPTGDATDSETEGCRNTIQTLYTERETLRAELQQLKAQLAPAGENKPSSDAYVTLFPDRTSTSPLVIVLLVVLLAYGAYTISQSGLTHHASTLPDSPAAALVPPSPATTPEAPSAEVTAPQPVVDPNLAPVVEVPDSGAAQSALTAPDPNDALPGEGPGA